MFDLLSIVRAVSDWLNKEKTAAKQAEPEHPAVARARRIAAGPSTYILGAGGRDPKADTPFTKKDGRLGSDCVGFTSWCLGHDRYQPASFPFYDGWINTDSLMQDARSKMSWYIEVERPEPGDVVVFPSIHRDGKRVRIGHIALVTEVPPNMPAYIWDHRDRREWLQHVKVIDCAAAASRRLKGRAVAETTAASSWDKPDAMWARLARKV